MTRYAATLLLVVAMTPSTSQAHALEKMDVCATDLQQVEASVASVSARYEELQRTFFKRRSTLAHTQDHVDHWIAVLRSSRNDQRCTPIQKARLMQFQFDLERLLEQS